MYYTDTRFKLKTLRQREFIQTETDRNWKWMSLSLHSKVYRVKMVLCGVSFKDFGLFIVCHSSSSVNIYMSRNHIKNSEIKGKKTQNKRNKNNNNSSSEPNSQTERFLFHLKCCILYDLWLDIFFYFILNVCLVFIARFILT